MTWELQAPESDQQKAGMAAIRVDRALPLHNGAGTTSQQIIVINRKASLSRPNPHDFDIEQDDSSNIGSQCLALARGALGIENR